MSNNPIHIDWPMHVGFDGSVYAAPVDAGPPECLFAECTSEGVHDLIARVPQRSEHDSETLEVVLGKICSEHHALLILPLTPADFSLGVRACRVCGCTDDRACLPPAGPCHWVEQDLCSACIPKEPCS